MKLKEHNPSIGAISEVELSTQELAALSRPPEDELAQACTDFALSAQQGNALPASTPTILIMGMLPSWVSGLSGARALGLAGLAVVASIAVGAHYEYSESKRAAPPRVELAWTPLPERPTPAAEIQIEAAPMAEPTLFTNPFDETEVFELEPGLTQDEARAIVAELLMERARERVARR